GGIVLGERAVQVVREDPIADSDRTARAARVHAPSLLVGLGPRERPAVGPERGEFLDVLCKVVDGVAARRPGREREVNCGLLHRVRVYLNVQEMRRRMSETKVIMNYEGGGRRHLPGDDRRSRQQEG